MESQIPEELLELIDNPNITDICLSPGQAQVDGGAGLEDASVCLFDEPKLAELAKSLIELGGRRLDQANPFSDVSLPGGLRVHAVLKSASSQNTQISIRLHSTKQLSLMDLLEGHFANPAQAQQLLSIAESGQSFLIAGATGTGKTTLLKAMLAQRLERVIAVEDVTELSAAVSICLQARPKNIEGQGEITLAELVRQALRMRPDRICIGEVRGQELVPMLQALNTGHRGATTLHANSLEQIPERLLSIATEQGISEKLLAKLVAAAFDWVIYLSKEGGSRKVSGIGRFELVENQLQVIPSFRARKLQLA